jgi:transcriptional regulator GlxA family with amidase domain
VPRPAPHALQLANRSRSAGCLLEAGQTTAVAAGFADQSHLHRHLQRSLGVIPAEYKQRFGT